MISQNSFERISAYKSGALGLSFAFLGRLAKQRKYFLGGPNDGVTIKEHRFIFLAVLRIAFTNTAKSQQNKRTLDLGFVKLVVESNIIFLSFDKAGE